MSLSVLAAWPGDLIQSRKMRVLRFQDSFLKNFLFFPQVSVTVHCLPQNISLKHSVSLLKKLPFLHHVFFKHQEKGRVFSISLHCSWFELYFLDLWDTTVFFEIICSNMGLPKMLGMIVWGWFLLLLSLFSVIFFIKLLVCVLSIVIW